MKILKRFLCGAGLVLFLLPIHARDGKVEVVNPGSRELKRSAFRLRMPVERLKNARAALQEATDIARLARPTPVEHFFQLGDFWVQLNRPKAEEAINGMLSTLRTAAQGATAPGQYRDATTAAQMLISSLSQVDPDQSVQWAREWPKPSPSLGPETQASNDDLERQLRRSALQRLAYSDPEAALRIWSAGPDRAADDYDVRGPLAAQLARTGRTEEANKIVDRTLAEFAAANPDPSAWNSYGNFLSSLSQAAPDRFLEAFRLWARNPPPGIPATGGPMLSAGDQAIPLDSSEAAALNILRSIGSRPELMMNALDSVPTLKAKIDQAGGIDRALNGTSGMRGGMFARNPDGSMRAGGPDSDKPDAKPDAPTLFGALRGKAARNPELVRNRLTAITNPEHVDQLLQIAMMSYGQDPDLTCLAVEMARPIVLRIDPPARRLSYFQQLVMTTRQCEGEVDSSLIKEGFVLADELREKEKDRGGPPARPGHSAADQLEATLLSELARDNFDAAIRYVRSMSEDQQKLGALMRILQSCRQF